MKRKTGKITRLMTLLLIATIAPMFNTMAQMICDISIDTPMPVCPGIYFELSVFEELNQTFTWQEKKGDIFIDIGNESILGISIVDSTVFRVVVIDTLTPDTCISDLFSVSVRPQIFIEFDQKQLTCTNGDKNNGNSAQVRAIATGELETDEYHYFWDVPPLHIATEDSALAVSLKAHQFYNITVKDNYGCPQTESYRTEAYDNPEVEIFADPDTAFLQNPYITYSYINLSEDSISLKPPSWWFSDTVPDPDYNNTSDLPEPTYMYGSVGEYFVLLTVVSASTGCDTTFSHDVVVKPIKLLIPNVFTPNGDKINDEFVITNDTENKNEQIIEDALSRFYKRSRLVVFNRGGRTVFDAENYNNTWGGDNLPDGVYYYVLECEGEKTNDVFKGSVTIIR
ncbi:MAG: gliding motility-associated C-terminal domain-containing protein [Bacteroidetes bacterium]|nr:gliding motility-associated C-terminal domain-containing protein [Bacteroidota bacterium]